MKNLIGKTLTKMGITNTLDQSAHFGLVSTAETNPVRRGSREYWPTDSGKADFDQLVNEWDREHIVSCSVKLYGNFPPVKGAVDSKATYAVGRAWQPVSKAKDREWGRKAQELIRTMWYPVADVAGSDFVSQLFVGSVSIDRDGGFGILLSKTETGFPQVQFIPGSRIGGNGGALKLESGPFAGYRLKDGVIVNGQGRAVGYRIRTDDNTYRDVSTRNFIYVHDPAFFGQRLGLPSYFSAIESARASLSASSYEEFATMLGSAHTLIEYNEQGGPDPNDPAFGLGDGSTNADGIGFKKMMGGLVNHFRSNSGSKLEMFKSDRPGPAWESFQDRLIRMVHTAMSWPTELTWKASDLTTPSVRLRVHQAGREVEDRQTLLMPVAQRSVGYAVACFMQMGLLDYNDEWYKWDFTLPAKLSVDLGRDSKATRADYDKGIRNLTDILGESGKDLTEHLNERADEELLIDEIANARGVSAERLVNHAAK